MKAPVTDLPAVYLKPGELYITDSPTVVTTVLGSCVSVTMFCPRLKIGAICHGLLPNCKDDKPCDNSCGNAFRYVDCSIRLMLGKIRGYGIGDHEMEVKLFGGADMFSPLDEGRKANTIGNLNIQAAIRILDAEKLQILKADIGGMQGRKILFYTHTGEVFLKRVRRTELEESNV
ncbi:MAG: chemotaxis protein CheD [Nitrospirae bacterium]|nr:chemotaxis protein CheD [Nitrospirota bacterium]